MKFQGQVPRIKALAAGTLASYCVSESGECYSFGGNDNGELGIGKKTDGEDSPYPTLISREKYFDGEEIKDVFSGSAFAVVLTNTGRVFIWGSWIEDDTDKRMAINELFEPKEIILPNNRKRKCKVIKVAVGNSHVLLLDSDNRLYSMGWNAYGQLGLGYSFQDDGLKKKEGMRFVNRLTDITKITLKNFKDSKITNIFAAHNTSWIEITSLKGLGKVSNVYGWGNNIHGQVGVGIISGKRNTNYSNFLLIPKKILRIGTSKIIDIKGGKDFTIFLNEMGQIYSCGRGDLGQLGLQDVYKENLRNERRNKKESHLPAIFRAIPRRIKILLSEKDVKRFPKISKISACSTSVLCTSLLNEQLIAWGQNYSGQLGLGENKEDDICRDAMLPTVVPFKNKKLKCKHLSVGYQHSLISLIEESQ